ncbi:MAG: AraC family transcriptional regulator, partial [Puniceicoccales bacterium]
MNHPNPKNIRIAILIGTSATWARNVIFGIDRYLRKESNYWHIFIQPLGSNQNLRLPEGWIGDGVIADIHDTAMARRLHALDIPVVTVSQSTFKNMAFP